VKRAAFGVVAVEDAPASFSPLVGSARLFDAMNRRGDGAPLQFLAGERRHFRQAYRCKLDSLQSAVQCARFAQLHGQCSHFGVYLSVLLLLSPAIRLMFLALVPSGCPRDKKHLHGREMR